MYPVAKLVGAYYEDIQSTLGYGLHIINDYYNTDSDLKNYLNPLYTNSNTSGSLISVYTFQPLVGMTSETGPNGKTTYYEYDDFGRLNCIKDHDGNKIKEYDYHYKGQ